jgi:hypothetical protein
VYAPAGGQGLNVDAANLGRKLAAIAHGWVGEDILDTYTTERHPVAARLLQNTRAQIALMRPDPQTRALWEMLSDLIGLRRRPSMRRQHLAGMDVRYDLGDDHRLVGTLCPDMNVAHPAPTAVSLGLAHQAGPRRHHAGACAGHLVRPTGLSAVLTIVSDSLGTQ